MSPLSGSEVLQARVRHDLCFEHGLYRAALGCLNHANRQLGGVAEPRHEICVDLEVVHCAPRSRDLVRRLVDAGEVRRSSGSADRHCCAIYFDHGHRVRDRFDGHGYPQEQFALSHLVGFEGPEECETPRGIFQESFAIQLYRMPETGNGDSRLRLEFFNHGCVIR